VSDLWLHPKYRVKSSDTSNSLGLFRILKLVMIFLSVFVFLLVWFCLRNVSLLDFMVSFDVAARHKSMIMNCIFVFLYV
jgi:hypothetical protein